MKDVEQFTGVGKPPYCEIILRAAMPQSSESTPPDLTLPVILTGVQQPTTITLKKVAQQRESALSTGQETGKLCNLRLKNYLIHACAV